MTDTSDLLRYITQILCHRTLSLRVPVSSVIHFVPRGEDAGPFITIHSPSDPLFDMVRPLRAQLPRRLTRLSAPNAVGQAYLEEVLGQFDVSGHHVVGRIQGRCDVPFNLHDTVAEERMNDEGLDGDVTERSGAAWGWELTISLRLYAPLGRSVCGDDEQSTVS